MDKVTFYIARHGKTMMNTLDRVQGWCDSPLTNEGIRVARYLGCGLKDMHFRSAYCSDLRRTRQTAEIILAAKGQEEMPVTEIPGFKEVCFGHFEADLNSVMWGEAGKRFGYHTLDEMSQAFARKEVDFRDILRVIKEIDTFGMAESYEEVENRTQKALTELALAEERKGEGNVLIIAHGMSILAMLSSLGGQKLLDGTLENASVCKVTYEGGGFSVESMGDMSYVAKGARQGKDQSSL